MECGDERAAPADSCRAIGERMPASQNDKWFGLANDRLGRPDIKLPRVLRESVSPDLLRHDKGFLAGCLRLTLLVF